ncbi:glutamate-1-semialdehyde 2,1-aminomutase [Ignavigranum ruoffiae]|uniref:Glutamate-1-semialdehyde 2,1-aminomutase n=1 Tax=Ignavigranum ruoffiae TaxID=89093 RepID=A0A1H9CH21_9LACT|nr:glutamate-1-semialdehyde 2,1-aminomutase [Ignavigranum ruoffiae]
MNQKSEIAFKEALDIFPGGVNSPVRAFKSLDIVPPFIQKGQDQYIFDIDNKKYIDYVLSWGPLILGHSDPRVVESITKQAQNGITFGAPTLLESDLGKTIIERFDTIDKVRFVNSGTEATMSAVRLARGFTKRDLIIKFDGCYHGHSDSFLVKAGSGIATFGTADSAGVPREMAKLTISVPYNDEEAVRDVFNKYGNKIAAVIIEPVAGNMGLVLAKPSFLNSLRDLTNQYHSLLIFDEVMSGFRCDYIGAQNYYNIKPDITTLGKVIGGGLPVAAYGARKEIMNCIAPVGDVYQAGTLSGNPLGMTAGNVTLTSYNEEDFKLASIKVDILCQNIEELANKYGFKVQAPHLGTMFSIFFNNNPVRDFEDSMSSNQELFNAFFIRLLNKGIYFASSQFETNFISLKHSDEDITHTLKMVEETFKELKGEGYAEGI